jgi:uncharacterized membrane protein YdjX (TVP38/TMEM64 family)
MTMSSPQAPDETGQAAAPRHSFRRLVPLVLLLLLACLFVAMGWHRQLSFEAVVRHHASIHEFIVSHRLVAVAAYVALYAFVVALSLPVGVFMTPVGGMLFGGVVGGLAAIVGATAGATVIFLIARSAFGEHLARRAGPLAEKIAAGFRADAFNYLLFLRLVPAFPFFLVNLVPALAGVRLGTFVGATAIGIVPAAFALAFIGAGLDSVIRAQGVAYHACVAAGRPDCRVDFDLQAALTPELLLALTALGVLALVPVLVKRLRARGAAPVR